MMNGLDWNDKGQNNTLEEEDNVLEGALVQDFQVAYQKDKIQKLEMELTYIRNKQKNNIENHNEKDEVEVEEVQSPDNDFQNSMQFCLICNFHPPLRSHHCHDCKRCVGTYDHHCFCIGIQNIVLLFII